LPKVCPLFIYINFGLFHRLPTVFLLILMILLTY
jgi:hypothetical protein